MMKKRNSEADGVVADAKRVKFMETVPSGQAEDEHIDARRLLADSTHKLSTGQAKTAGDLGFAPRAHNPQAQRSQLHVITNLHNVYMAEQLVLAGWLQATADRHRPTLEASSSTSTGAVGPGDPFLAHALSHLAAQGHQAQTPALAHPSSTPSDNSQGPPAGTPTPAPNPRASAPPAHPPPQPAAAPAADPAQPSASPPHQPASPEPTPMDTGSPPKAQVGTAAQQGHPTKPTPSKPDPPPAAGQAPANPSVQPPASGTAAAATGSINDAKATPPSISSGISSGTSAGTAGAAGTAAAPTAGGGSSSSAPTAAAAAAAAASGGDGACAAEGAAGAGRGAGRLAGAAGPSGTVRQDAPQGRHPESGPADGVEEACPASSTGLAAATGSADPTAATTAAGASGGGAARGGGRGAGHGVGGDAAAGQEAVVGFPGGSRHGGPGQAAGAAGAGAEAAAGASGAGAGGAAGRPVSSGNGAGEALADGVAGAASGAAGRCASGGGGASVRWDPSQTLELYKGDALLEARGGLPLPLAYPQLVEALMGGAERGAAGAGKFEEWAERFEGVLGGAATMERLASAFWALQMDRQDAIAALSGRAGVYLLKRSTVLLGRSSDSRGPVDVDLAMEGPTAKVSRRQAVITVQLDGSFQLVCTGRRPMLLNGQLVARGQEVVLPHLGLLEVGGLHLLFTVNHLAVARVLRRTAALAM